MSLPTIQEYEQVVKNLMSPDNTVRGNAETYFNNSKAHPDFCVSSLIQLLRFSNDAQVRELSCLLVRKCIAKTEDSLYPKLSEEVKALVKKELISALESESIPTIRKKLTYAVSGLASGLLETGEYPELLPAMFNWTKSANPLHRESALLIFNQLATYLLDKGLSPYLKTLKAIFQSCLEDKESKKVRIAAITATTSVVLVLEKGPNRTLFQELISPMLSALGAALNERDSEGAQVAVESFIEIAEALPQFFKPKIIDVISAMFQIANTADLDESIRHLGMEFMITIAETAPTIVKKVPSFAQNLVPLCMNMMLDIEEDDEWNDTMTDDDQFELTNYDVGLEALDRLALALGGKLVQPIVFVCITPFLNSPDWKHRYAGLMTISQTAEGCKTQYETHLGEIVKMALALFKDPHPRVRYAAIHCTAQLSTDFSPNFQAVFHGMAVPALISAMDDEIPRVQCHAATAIVNFVEDCQHQFIEPYLDALLNKLLMLLQKGKRFVQEQTLSAISAVAGSSETLFRKYYSAIVPYLKVILTNATGQQDRMLRAKAMECVSLIGVAVGKEVFIQDAREIMDLLAKTQTSQMDPDDPQINYLLQAWARIAKCLGHDFIPYLEVVMPPLLASADIKPEVIVTDADEAQTEDEEGMESVTLSIKGVGDKRISIRTSVLEEKALACNMLYSYVYELKEGFFPYVDQVAKIMVPLLKFAYLDEIRETAATIMPELLKSVKARIEQGGVDPSLLKQLLDYILSAMLPALKIEPEVKTATILIEGFNDCIKAVPNDMVSQQHLESATQVLGEIVLASMQRRRNLESERDEQEDEEERDQYEEELYLEEELLSMTAECIGTLIKTQSAFLPYFAQFLWPIVCQMMSPDVSDQEQRIGVCVVCDFVEFGQGAALPYMEQAIIPTLLNYAVAESPEVRQASVYGIGACAQFGGEPFNAAIDKIIKALISAISMPNAREEEQAAATCNAVSALYKILEFRSQHPAVNQEQILSIFLNALPVTTDNIEARIVHEKFAALVAQSHPVILGPGNQNVPKIIKIFAQILDTDLVTDATQANIVAMLKQMQASLPAELSRMAWTILSDEERATLQKVMASS